MDANGSGLSKLTTDGQPKGAAPDVKRIAFTSWDSNVDAVSAEVYVIPTTP